MVEFNKPVRAQTPIRPDLGKEIYDPPRPGGPRLKKSTDITRWRMLDEGGRQTWHYLETEEQAKKWPQSAADKWYLEQETVRTFNYDCTIC